MEYNVVFVWLKLNIDMVIVSEAHVYIRVPNCICTARRGGVCVCVCVVEWRGVEIFSISLPDISGEYLISI